MLHDLDEKDLLILRLLQDNGRMTSVALSRALGTSVTRAFERIKKLEKENYILKYVALLDEKKIDRSLAVFIQVLLHTHGTAEVKKFEKEIMKLEEVMEFYHMSGEYDYLLKICVKDMDEYSAFIHKKMAGLLTVGSIQSYFVLREAKKTLAYDLTPPHA